MSAISKKSPIRDLGYSRYEGQRLPHRSRYGVLARRTLSLAWAGGLVKTTLILGMFPMVICGVVMYLKIKGAQTFAAQGVPLPAVLQHPEYWVFYCVYWCQIWFAFTMSLLVAAPAISEDVRTGAFQFYFSRPVGRRHYVVGKLASVSLLIVILCGGPGVLLALFRVALANDAAEALGRLRLLLAALVFSGLYAAVLTVPALALSTLSRKTGYVMGGWASLFFFPWVLGESTAAAADMPYVSLLSIPTNVRLLGQWLFGMEPSYDIPVLYPAAALLVLIGLSALLIWRRLERVEVFT